MVSASPGTRTPGAGRDELEGQGFQEVMQTLRGHGAGRPSISKDVGRGQQVVRGSGWSAYSGPGSRLCAFAHVRHGHMLPFSWQWCTKFF